MSKTSSTKLRDRSSSRSKGESNGNNEMDDPGRTMSRVAQFIEQLHTNKSSPPEKELITARLLGIAKSIKEARVLIGSHGRAMPLFISILRTGTLLAKINVAATLSVLCRDEDLQACVFRDSYENFKKAGAEVVGISGDDPSSHKDSLEVVGEKVAILLHFESPFLATHEIYFVGTWMDE